MLESTPVRTGQDHKPARPQPRKVLAIMLLLLLVAFLVLLGVASAVGLTADSRDGADWAATFDGQRQPRRS
jgi:hypothetical protein